MPDPQPTVAFASTLKDLLLSWAGVGAILAAGAVGYAGVTVAQITAMATADEAVSAVADPPAPATYAALAAPQPATPSKATSTAPSPSATEPQPSRPAERQPAASPTTRPAAPDPTAPAPAPRTKAGAIADSRPGARSGSMRQQREIERALRADRQLAAMLRATSPATSPVMQWFGGAPWTLPVGAYHLTARFGQSGSLWSSTHTGLDFAAPTGTPVRAVTAGTVTSVGWAGAYGNKIEISHPDGSETWYAHLSRTDVRVGTQVGTGAVIGAVGATGNVTGSHLHFEVRLADGSAVDPDATLRQHGLRP